MILHRIQKINTTLRPTTQCIEAYVLEELEKYAKGFSCSRAEIIRRILREYLTTSKHAEWSDSRTLDKIKEDVHFVLAGLGNDFKQQILTELKDEYCCGEIGEL